MKKLTVRIGKLVETPTPSSWSQVHTFFAEDPEKSKERGDLLAVLSVSGEEGVEALALGREIILRFHEEYYGQKEASAMVQLTKAVESVVDEFNKKGHSLEVVAGALLGEMLYVAIYGSGDVWVK